MVRNPLERSYLVEETAIRACLIVSAPHLGKVEETEHAQAIVDGDEDDVPAFDEPTTLVPPPTPRTDDEGAAVDIDHYRATLVVRPRSPDVQRQAIFIPGGEHFTPHEVEWVRILRRRRAEAGMLRDGVERYPFRRAES